MGLSAYCGLYVQIFQKVPINTRFLQKYLDSMDLGALQQYVIYECNLFLKKYSEMPNHSN